MAARTLAPAPPGWDRFTACARRRSWGCRCAGCARAAEGPLDVPLGLPRDQVVGELRHFELLPAADRPRVRRRRSRAATPRARLAATRGSSSSTRTRSRKSSLQRFERWDDDARAIDRWNQLVNARAKTVPASDRRRARGDHRAPRPATGHPLVAGVPTGDHTVVAIYLLTPRPPDNASVLEEIVAPTARPRRSSGLDRVDDAIVGARRARRDRAADRAIRVPRAQVADGAGHAQDDVHGAPPGHLGARDVPGIVPVLAGPGAALLRDRAVAIAATEIERALRVRLGHEEDRTRQILIRQLCRRARIRPSAIDPHARRACGDLDVRRQRSQAASGERGARSFFIPEREASARAPALVRSRGSAPPAF